VLTTARTDANVTVDKSVTANFAINTYTLHYTAGTGGTISGTADQTVAHGGSGTAVTAVPVTGYHFVSWSDGIATAARTDSNIAGSITVAAVFAVDAIDTRTLTYTAGSGGTISGTANQTVAYGGSGTAVTAVPATGYHFVAWSDGVTTAARTDSNVTADHTVSATFASTLTRTTIGVVANHSSVPRGHPVYFHGVISPNRTNGTHVGFYMRKAGSTTWKLVSTRHTFSGHHWSYSYHPSTRGTYYFQVRLSATSKYAPSTSKTIKVVWR
jgi:hypothetical protein